MPPIKICPHCKRETVCKFPVVVKRAYPLQCTECGAQLKGEAYDRTVAQDQVKLEE